MSDTPHDRVRAIIEKRHAKDAKRLERKPQRPRRKKRNRQPEELAVKEIKQWCENNKIQIHRYESKARWNAGAGRYLSDAVEPGHPDLAGVMLNGIAVYIEVKAKGKRYNASPGQLEFLKDKIRSNAFACVADSSEYLDFLIRRWFQIKRQDAKGAQLLLMNNLPHVREKDDDKNSFF